MILQVMSFIFKHIICFTGEKIDNSMNDNSKQLNLDPEIAQKSNSNKEICEFNSSKLRRFQGLFVIFSWITCFFRIWNIISYFRFPRFGKRKSEMFITI